MEERKRPAWQRAMSRRVNRRQLLQTGAAVGMAAPAAAALLATAGTASAATSTYGPTQTLIVATTISDAVTLDPGVAFEFSSVAAQYQTYNRLVQFPYGNLQKVAPALAEKWEASEDNRTWTFHLKPGVVFSSGNPVTADDVVYSLQRVVNIPKDPAQWLITQMGITAKNLTQTVKATDASTVVISLPQAFSPGAFLAVMANAVASVVDSKVVKAHESNGDWGSTWLGNHSAGSGPYILNNWTRDVQMEFLVNPKYNLGDQPAIKRLLWQGISNNATQLDMLKTGQADIATDLSSAQLASLKSNPQVTIFKTPDEAMMYVGMDVGNLKPLANADVRNAIKWAIDYDGIVNQLLNGNGTILQGIIPKGIFGYSDEQPFKQDLNKAKQLLASGGYPNGFKVEMLVPQGTVAGGISGATLASAIQANLSEIGITVSLRQLAASELYTEYREHKAQLVLGEWSMDYPDPQDFAGPFAEYSQQSLIWRLQDNDTELEKLANQAATLQNTPERQKLYDQLNALEAKQGPFALIYQPDVTLAYSTKLKGLKYDAANNTNYPEISKG